MDNATRYASAESKRKLIDLLNNPAITKAEKSKILPTINSKNEKQAALGIEVLTNIINYRTAKAS